MLDEYKKIAAKLIALKSVSSDPTLKEDCKKTAEFLVNLIKEYRFDTKAIEGYGNPVVFGSYVVNPKLETCLIYGHYDVQPAEKEDGWDSDPYTLVEKDGRYYGRGIMDDKCQFLVHIVTIGRLLKEKKLEYNIKFVFEGNEEEGSPYIEQFVKDHTEELACDFIMISDGELARGKPTLELSNRGIVNGTLTVKTATNELHSGIYGGASPNAIHELSKIIAKLFDENNKVTIQEFYDDVDPVDSSYAIPFDMDEYKKNSGTKALLTEPEYDFYTQTGLRPALVITGIFGGYIKEGHKTTIPHSATMKFNFRIVKSQTAKKIAEIVKKHFQEVIPEYIDYTLTFEEFADPNKQEKNNIYVQKAKEILEDVFKDTLYYKYVGGTEPVVLYFQEILQKPIVSGPFANEDGHMHAANENFEIKNIKRMMEFSERFFGK